MSVSRPHSNQRNTRNSLPKNQYDDQYLHIDLQNSFAISKPYSVLPGRSELDMLSPEQVELRNILNTQEWLESSNLDNITNDLHIETTDCTPNDNANARLDELQTHVIRSSDQTSTLADDNELLMYIQSGCDISKLKAMKMGKKKKSTSHLLKSKAISSDNHILMPTTSYNIHTLDKRKEKPKINTNDQLQNDYSASSKAIAPKINNYISFDMNLEKNPVRSVSRPKSPLRHSAKKKTSQYQKSTISTTVSSSVSYSNITLDQNYYENHEQSAQHKLAKFLEDKRPTTSNSRGNSDASYSAINIKSFNDDDSYRDSQSTSSNKTKLSRRASTSALLNRKSADSISEFNLDNRYSPTFQSSPTLGSININGSNSDLPRRRASNVDPLVFLSRRAKEMRNLKSQYLVSSGVYNIPMHPENSEELIRKNEEMMMFSHTVSKQIREKNREDNVRTILQTPGYLEAAGPEKVFSTDSKLNFTDKYSEAKSDLDRTYHRTSLGYAGWIESAALNRMKLFVPNGTMKQNKH